MIEWAFLSIRRYGIEILPKACLICISSLSQVPCLERAPICLRKTLTLQNYFRQKLFIREHALFNNGLDSYACISRHINAKNRTPRLVYYHVSILLSNIICSSAWTSIALFSMSVKIMHTTIVKEVILLTIAVTKNCRTISDVDHLHHSGITWKEILKYKSQAEPIWYSLKDIARAAKR